VVVKRECSKVLLGDEQNRVLLFSGIDRTKPDVPAWWFPVGGALETGESPAEAAIRETEEETGLRIADPGPVVFTRSLRFDFEGQEYDQHEWFFLVRVDGFSPVSTVWTDTEIATIRETRWWSIEELRSTDEEVFPEDIADHLERILGLRSPNPSDPASGIL
jgi:8-oxo-dGTP pyrophosphatase MutT (NUDIX family)